MLEVRKIGWFPVGCEILTPPHYYLPLWTTAMGLVFVKPCGVSWHEPESILGTPWFAEVDGFKVVCKVSSGVQINAHWRFYTHHEDRKAAEMITQTCDPGSSVFTPLLVIWSRHTALSTPLWNLKSKYAAQFGGVMSQNFFQKLWADFYTSRIKNYLWTLNNCFKY